VHYFLGDLVTGYFEGITATKQISAVTVTFAPGSDRAETISVETRTV
jgi:phage terminase large subunit-like protein